jgi:hypothetical protein
MTVILHIGFPKTGSSALQYGFARNRDRLAALGIHYGEPPVSPLETPTGVTAGNGSFLARFLVEGRLGANTDRGTLARRFRRRYLSPDHPVALVSSEALSLAEPDLLRWFKEEIVPGHDVVVVAFIRNLYDHLRSSWTNLVKGSASTKSFAAYAATANNMQVVRLRRFHEALGRDALRLVHYDGARADLLTAFMTAAGFPAEGLDTALPLVNRGFSPVECDVLLACNALHGEPEIGRLIANGLLVRHPDRRAAAPVDQEVLGHIEDRFRADVDWVNATFFGGEPRLRIHDGGPPGAQSDVDREAVWRDVSAIMFDAFKAARDGDA